MSNLLIIALIIIIGFFLVKSFLKAVSCLVKTLTFLALIGLTIYLIYFVSYDKLYYRTNHNQGDYQTLTQLLNTQDWKSANQETYQLMLDITNRQKQGWLTTRAIETFPCDQLKKIDQLWLNASDNQFGFTIQAEIVEKIQEKIKNNKLDFFRLDELIYQAIPWQNPNIIKEKIKGYYPTPIGNDSVKACLENSLDKLYFGQGQVCYRKVYKRLEECPTASAKFTGNSKNLLSLIP
jgi:hypothetical protein